MFVRLRVGTKNGAPQKEAKSELAVEQRESAPASATRTEPARGRDRSEMVSHEPSKPGGPHIKTYVAASVPQAMLMARRELGEEAILIQTTRRKTDNRTEQYEVTFGVIPGAPPSAEPARSSAQMLEAREELTRVRPVRRADVKAICVEIEVLDVEHVQRVDLKLRSRAAGEAEPLGEAEVYHLG